MIFTICLGVDKEIVELLFTSSQNSHNLEVVIVIPLIVTRGGLVVTVSPHRTLHQEISLDVSRLTSCSFGCVDFPELVYEGIVLNGIKSFFYVK